jgi:hypothetical protein
LRGKTDFLALPGLNVQRLDRKASQRDSTVVAGFVKNGVVVPNAPLPEGAFVEVHVIGQPMEVPSELQEEFDAWDRASAESLELVERLAREGEDDAKR